MRSEHNHPPDEIAYEEFLKTAVKVRKFTKRVQKSPEKKEILPNDTSDKTVVDLDVAAEKDIEEMMDTSMDLLSDLL